MFDLTAKYDFILRNFACLILPDILLASRGTLFWSRRFNRKKAAKIKSKQWFATCQQAEFFHIDLYINLQENLPTCLDILEYLCICWELSDLSTC